MALISAGAVRGSYHPWISVRQVPQVWHRLKRLGRVLGTTTEWAKRASAQGAIAWGSACRGRPCACWEQCFAKDHLA
jgi:hypothetical protein